MLENCHNSRHLSIDCFFVAFGKASRVKLKSSQVVCNRYTMTYTMFVIDTKVAPFGTPSVGHSPA